MIGLLAARWIDLAIFGTLGTLWVGGAAFIYVLYRWILLYERSPAHAVTRPTVDDQSAPLGSEQGPAAVR